MTDTNPISEAITVVPAEGLDAEHLVAAWLDETEVFATRRERLMDDVLAECDLAPWLHAACQVGIDAALRAHQPAMQTAWELTPSEVARVVAGQPIILTLLGRGHPPVLIEVAGQDAEDGE